MKKIKLHDSLFYEYDVTQNLNGEVFKPLKDKTLFMNTCTVMNGTLAWDVEGNRDVEKCIDIDPFTLYECPSVNQQIA